MVLGSGGGIPSLHRALPAVLVRRGGAGLLLDCGEGTQMQLMRSGHSAAKVGAVFISHLHGDHVNGLPGLLMSLAQQGRTEPLRIWGPPPLRAFLEAVRRYLRFRPPYELVVEETRGGTLAEGPCALRALPLRHRGPTLGLVLEEPPRPGRFSVEAAERLGIPEGPVRKRLQQGETVEVNGRLVRPEEVLGPPRRGRKVVYATDTRPSPQLVEAARGADLLIHDGMFAEDLRQEAELRGHSTARQAALVAREAGVRQLLITHISPRYPDERVLLQEAREVFPQTVVARDLLEIEVPLPD